MKQGNTGKGGMVIKPAMYLRARVDESDPRTWKLPQDYHRVLIECSYNKQSLLPKLLRTIEKYRAWKAVDDLKIGYGSSTETLEEWLRVLPQLTALDLVGKNIKRISDLIGSNIKFLALAVSHDIDDCVESLACLQLRDLMIVAKNPEVARAVGRIRGLDQLVVNSWPFKDLVELGECDPKRLVVHQSGIETTLGISACVYKSLDFSGCRKLTTLCASTARSLEIVTCPRIDYATVPNVSGVRSVHIREQPVIKSVKFLLECPNLIDLFIVATKVNAPDVESLAQSGTLKRVWISPPVPEAQAIALSKGKQGLIVANGRNCYVNGASVDLQKTYRDWRMPEGEM